MEFLKNAGSVIIALVLGIAGVWAIADQMMSRTVYFRFGIDMGRETSPAVYYAVIGVQGLFVLAFFVYAFFEGRKLFTLKPSTPLEDHQDG